MQICSVKYQLLFCKKLFYENTAPGPRFDIQAFAGAVRVRLSIIPAGIPIYSVYLDISPHNTYTGKPHSLHLQEQKSDPVPARWK